MVSNTFSAIIRASRSSLITISTTMRRMWRGAPRLSLSRCGNSSLNSLRVSMILEFVQRRRATVHWHFGRSQTCRRALTSRSRRCVSMKLSVRVTHQVTSTHASVMSQSGAATRSRNCSLQSKSQSAIISLMSVSLAMFSLDMQWITLRLGP